MVDDGENLLLKRIWRSGIEEQAADAVAHALFFRTGNELVGGLLHLVVRKAKGQVQAIEQMRFIGRVGVHVFVGITQRQNQPFTQWLTQVGKDLARLLFGYGDQSGEVEFGADTGGQLQDLARSRRLLAQFIGHELGQIVRQMQRLNLAQIPDPGSGIGGESNESVLMQVHQQLVDEEGIALGLAMNQVGQRRDLIGSSIERISYQLADMGGVQQA